MTEPPIPDPLLVLARDILTTNTRNAELTEKLSKELTDLVTTLQAVTATIVQGRADMRPQLSAPTPKPRTGQ